MPDFIIEWSRSLERECVEYGFAYVDMAGDFEANLARASATLVHSASGDAQR